MKKKYMYVFILMVLCLQTLLALKPLVQDIETLKQQKKNLEAEAKKQKVRIEKDTQTMDVLYKNTLALKESNKKVAAMIIKLHNNVFIIDRKIKEEGEKKKVRSMRDALTKLRTAIAHLKQKENDNFQRIADNRNQINKISQEQAVMKIAYQRNLNEIKRINIKLGIVNKDNQGLKKSIDDIDNLIDNAQDLLDEEVTKEK